MIPSANQPEFSMTHASSRSASTLYLIDIAPFLSHELNPAARKLGGCPITFPHDRDYQRMREDEHSTLSRRHRLNRRDYLGWQGLTLSGQESSDSFDGGGLTIAIPA